MTSQAGFSNLKQAPKLHHFHDSNVNTYSKDVEFCHFLNLPNYKKAHISGYCVLPVTSQPGVGGGNSTHGKGVHPRRAPLIEAVVASKRLGQYIL